MSKIVDEMTDEEVIKALIFVSKPLIHALQKRGYSVVLNAEPANMAEFDSSDTLTIEKRDAREQPPKEM
jgi:hypothetical protein